jgi:hypothetical protein
MELEGVTLSDGEVRKRAASFEAGVALRQAQDDAMEGLSMNGKLTPLTRG